MRLIRRDRGGRRYDGATYETPDGRFVATWTRVQGARSRYVVHDRQQSVRLFAYTLAEVRETIRDLRRVHS